MVGVISLRGSKRGSRACSTRWRASVSADADAERAAFACQPSGRTASKARASLDDNERIARREGELEGLV